MGEGYYKEIGLKEYRKKRDDLYEEVRYLRHMDGMQAKRAIMHLVDLIDELAAAMVNR